jgi:hypothetical protein
MDRGSIPPSSTNGNPGLGRYLTECRVEDSGEHSGHERLFLRVGSKHVHFERYVCLDVDGFG